MVDRIKVNINGKTVEALVVSKIYEIKKTRIIKGKKYTWIEKYLHVYIPEDLVASKYIVIPVKE